MKEIKPTKKDVPSSDINDLLFNSGRTDEFVTSKDHYYIDRFGEKHYTIEGINYLLKQAMSNYGYITKKSFESGNTIVNPNDVLLWESSGEYYRWDGQLPKEVSAGSTPESAGGIGNEKWIGVGDASLRGALAKNTGATLVKCASGNTVQQELDANKTRVANALSRVNQSQLLSSFSENGGQVFALRSDLENPLNQFVGIYLVGDSITWGLSASHYATSEPRNHSLSDARNNSTSPSWANLFHKYLGERFFKNPTYTEANWPSSPSGVCEFTYKERINLYPFYTPFVRTSGWSDIIKAGSLLNRVVESTTLNSEISFEFTGYEFDVIFSSLDNSGTLSVYSNDTLIDTIDTSAATNGGVKFQNKHTVSLPAFSSKANIRLVFTTGAWMRLEGIIVNKTVRVTNQGLIGTNSDEWVSSLIQPARRTGDKYCFIQLGTNDRGGASSARASNAISKNMQVFAEYLRGQGVQSIFMCANNVTQTGNFYYHMQDVSRAIANSAKSQLVDFINHLPVTTLAQTWGVDIVVNDKLHPNDVGHYMMFLNIITAIENASESTPSRNITVKKSFTVAAGASNITMRLPLLSSRSQILSCLMRIDTGLYTTTFGDVLTGAVSNNTMISGAIKRITSSTSTNDNVVISISNQTGASANISVELLVRESLVID